MESMAPCVTPVAMPHWSIDGNDVDTVIAEFGKAVDRARSGGGPSYIVANSYSFRGHSMSDAMKNRKGADGKWSQEVEEAKKRDHRVIGKQLAGIGIDPNFYDRVFTIFQRIHRREEYPGTGIGLSTCQKFIRLCGGDIRFESVLGEGTVFYFTLPVEGK